MGSWRNAKKFPVDETVAPHTPYNKTNNSINILKNIASGSSSDNNLRNNYIYLPLLKFVIRKKKTRNYARKQSKDNLAQHYDTCSTSFHRFQCLLKVCDVSAHAECSPNSHNSGHRLSWHSQVKKPNDSSTLKHICFLSFYTV